MKLFDLQRSPNCRRVRVLARELGLPLELVPTDFTSMKQPGYRAHNPAGKVPTFVDDDGELGRFLPILDARLTDVEHLTGRYSIADIATGCSLEDCEARGAALDLYTRLTAWRERLRQRAAWAD